MFHQIMYEMKSFIQILNIREILNTDKESSILKGTSRSSGKRKNKDKWSEISILIVQRNGVSSERYGKTMRPDLEVKIILMN